MENLRIVSVLAVAAGIWGTVGAVTIDVPAGETVTRSDAIADTTIVKTGQGRLVLSGANSAVTGGVTVEGGVLEVAGASALGSGPLTVKPTGDKDVMVVFNVSNGNFGNALNIRGESSYDYPALHVAKSTVLNGDVSVTGADGTGAGVFYATTGWDDTTSMATTTGLNFKGKITATGGTLAFAPHCQVNFSKTIICHLLKLHWRPNSASSDGGNPGQVLLQGFGDDGSTMDIVEIDQTSIVAGGTCIFGDLKNGSGTKIISVLKWTGEHKTGGSINVGCQKLSLGRVYNRSTTPDDETSQRIYSTDAARAVYFNLYGDFFDENNQHNCYLKFDLGYNMQVASGGRRYDAPTSSLDAKDTVFRDRHHKTANGLSTKWIFVSACSLTGGMRFDSDVTFSANANVTLDSRGLTDPAAFANLTKIDYGSKVFTFTLDAASYATLPKGYLLSLTGTTGSFKPTLPANGVLHLKSMTRNSVAVPAGEYVAGTTLSGYGVTLSGSNAKIVVAQTGSEIPQTVDDFTFTGTEGYAMTGDLLAKSITLAAGNTPTYRVSGADNVVASLSGTFGFAASPAAATAYVFEPLVSLADAQDFAIPAGSRLEFAGGLVAASSLVNSGKGTLALGNGSLLKKGLRMDDGVLELSGQIGGSTVITNRMIAGTMTAATLVLSNAVVNIPTRSGSGSQYTLPVVLASPTNVFQAVHNTDGSASFAFTNRTEGPVFVDYRNGVVSGGKMSFQISGATRQLTVRLGPGSQSGVRSWAQHDGFVTAFNGVHLIIDAPTPTGANTSMLESYGSSGSHTEALIDLRHDYWFQNDSSYITNFYYKAFRAVDYGRITLNATKQRGSTLFGNQTGIIEGEEGSLLELYTKCPAEDSRNLFLGTVRGELSITMKGTGLQRFGGVNTSTGMLTVEDGVVELRDGSTWAGSVRLKGGTLRIGKCEPGSDRKRLCLESGCLYLGDSEEPVRNGVYTSANTHGVLAADCAIKVGTLGMTVIFR